MSGITGGSTIRTRTPFLAELSDEGLEFSLIVLGQNFSRRPKVFALAEEKLRRHIVHFGYAGSEQDYIRLLRLGDIVVSTARHEFFGLAVLEAVRCGCRPLVPDGLAYRELYAYQPFPGHARVAFADRAVFVAATGSGLSELAVFFLTIGSGARSLNGNYNRKQDTRKRVVNHG